MPKETASTPADDEFDETLEDEQTEATDSTSSESEKERIQRSKNIAAQAKGKTPKKGKATPKRNSKRLTVEAEKHASMTKEQLRSSGKKQTASDANPAWFKPIMFGFLIVGFLWIIVYYLSQGYFPVQALGDWNILVGFGIALVGFLMMTNWK